MTCPFCGATLTSIDHYATGDWNALFACGTTADDNGARYRTAECERLADAPPEPGQ